MHHHHAGTTPPAPRFRAVDCSTAPPPTKQRGAMGKAPKQKGSGVLARLLDIDERVSHWYNVCTTNRPGEGQAQLIGRLCKCCRPPLSTTRDDDTLLIILLVGIQPLTTPTRDHTDRPTQFTFYGAYHDNLVNKVHRNICYEMHAWVSRPIIRSTAAAPHHPPNATQHTHSSSTSSVSGPSS